jgi:hypothetical protein
MKAKELRVGNLIRWISTGEIQSVKDIDTANRKYELINNVNISDVAGIELTEEWLLNFGFEFEEGVFYKGRIDAENLMGDEYNLRIRIDNENSAFLNYVPYIHTLQNLYFALEGEELTLSDK